jgi:hypothetical protein
MRRTEDPADGVKASRSFPVVCLHYSPVAPSVSNLILA